MVNFNIDLLFETYSELVTGEYKKALESLIRDFNSYSPPTINIADATINEAAQHVQNCAQYYATISVLTGCARSAQKLAQGQYKHNFEKHLLEADAKNKEAREAQAAAAVKEYSDQMLFFDSALNLFSSMEQAARSSADSSRKIAELIHSQRITEAGNKY